MTRLAASGRLPPDSHSIGGRRQWLQSTLDAYRLGEKRNHTYAYVSSPALAEFSVHLRQGHTIMGHLAVCTHLPTTNRAEAYAALLTYITRVRPSALILPAKNVSHPGQQTIIELCASIGICVFLLPG